MKKKYNIFTGLLLNEEFNVLETVYKSQIMTGFIDHGSHQNKLTIHFG